MKSQKHFPSSWMTKDLKFS